MMRMIRLVYLQHSGELALIIQNHLSFLDSLSVARKRDTGGRIAGCYREASSEDR